MLLLKKFFTLFLSIHLFLIQSTFAMKIDALCAKLQDLKSTYEYSSFDFAMLEDKELQKWANSDGLNSALEEIFPEENYHLISPASFMTSPSDENHIGGVVEFQILLKNKIEQDGGSLKKPVISVWNTVTAKDYSEENQGSHWQTIVILPKQYNELENENELILFKDSLNENMHVPFAIQYLLKNKFSCKKYEDLEDELELGGNLFDAIIVDDSNASNKIQQQGYDDCGWWALYNAIMLVKTGIYDYLSDAGPSRKNGIVLRLIMQAEGFDLAKDIEYESVSKPSQEVTSKQYEDKQDADYNKLFKEYLIKEINQEGDDARLQLPQQSIEVLLKIALKLQSGEELSDLMDSLYTTPSQEKHSTLEIDKLLVLFQMPKSFGKYNKLKAEEKEKITKHFPSVPSNAKEYGNFLTKEKDNLLLNIYGEWGSTKENFGSEITASISDFNIEGLDDEDKEEGIEEIKSYLDGFYGRKRESLGKIKTQEEVLKSLLFAEKELALENSFQVKKLPSEGHASDVYIIAKNGKRTIDTDNPKTIDYYAKTFFNEAEGRKIDPNEPFLYKVLELLDLGPRCWLLLKTGSTSMGSIARGNFIVTENVGKENSFLLDTPQQIFPEVLAENRDFSINSSKAFLISQILAMKDVFFQNAHNYGLVLSDFKISFIDHLPDVTNGFIQRIREYGKLGKAKKEILYSSSYSPRELFFNQKLQYENGVKYIYNDGDEIKEEVHTKVYSKKFGDIIDIAYKSREHHSRANIRENLNAEELMIRTKNLIDKASAFVLSFINDPESAGCFINDAESRLEEYITKIRNNIATFKSDLLPSCLSGVQINDPMSTKFINNNINLLINSYDNSVNHFFIENNVKNLANIFLGLQSWVSEESKAGYIGISYVKNNHIAHSVLIHGITHSNGHAISIIDPMNKNESPFVKDLENFASIIQKYITNSVEILYMAEQDAEYSVCADLSLIYMQNILEKINSPDILITNNLPYDHFYLLTQQIIKKPDFSERNEILDNNIYNSYINSFDDFQETQNILRTINSATKIGAFLHKPKYDQIEELKAPIIYFSTLINNNLAILNIPLIINSLDEGNLTEAIILLGHTLFASNPYYMTWNVLWNGPTVLNNAWQLIIDIMHDNAERAIAWTYFGSDLAKRFGFDNISQRLTDKGHILYSLYIESKYSGGEEELFEFIKKPYLNELYKKVDQGLSIEESETILRNDKVIISDLYFYDSKSLLQQNKDYDLCHLHEIYQEKKYYYCHQRDNYAIDLISIDNSSMPKVINEFVYIETSE